VLAGSNAAAPTLIESLKGSPLSALYSSPAPRRARIGSMSLALHLPAKTANSSPPEALLALVQLGRVPLCCDVMIDRHATRRSIAIEQRACAHFEATRAPFAIVDHQLHTIAGFAAQRACERPALEREEGLAIGQVRAVGLRPIRAAALRCAVTMSRRAPKKPPGAAARQDRSVIVALCKRSWTALWPTQNKNGVPREEHAVF
jgi:hypothetical protein